MKHLSSIVVLLGLFVPGSSSAQDATELIPKGTVNARIMVIAASARGEELGARLQAAVAENREWFLEHVKTAQPGEPLAWDPRMGVDEQEYEEFLREARRMEMRPTGEEESLTFDWEGESLVSLEAAGQLRELGGYTIDLRDNVVVSPFGRLEHVSVIDNSDPDSPTGPWRGVQWQLERGDPATDAVAASFAIGRRGGGEEGILYIDAKRITAGELSERSSFLLVYGLP